MLDVWRRLLTELGPRTPQLGFAGKLGWKIDAFRERLADYVRPDDIDGFVRTVRRMTIDDGYRQSREQSLTMAPMRSWADVAADFRRLIE
jgi:hypothetical protein